MTEFDIICDLPRRGLKEFPEKVLKLYNLRMLYLEGNEIEKLPDELFVKLYKLTWLDLRNNRLKAIPHTIGQHRHLENLLLSGNQITSLPNELGLVHSLKVLQIANNPLVYPDRIIMAQGVRAVCNHLRVAYERDKALGQDNKYDMGDSTRINDRIDDPISRKIDEQLERKKSNNVEISHKMTKDLSKISIHSRTSVKVPDTTIPENKDDLEALQQTWMSKMKQLLIEQEKILQREKDIRVLKTWREESKMKASSLSDMKPTQPPPFDTDPAYKIPSRSDLERSIDYDPKPRPVPQPRPDVDAMMKELAMNLKSIETSYDNTSEVPEAEEVGEQIKQILAIHKKLQQIKTKDL